MHGEMDLIRDDRKQLAELTIEYPPKKKPTTPQQEGALPEQRRKFTRINCRRPFSAPIGKTNHIKQSRECQNVGRRETFGKCQDCGRTFKEPVNLRQHRQFVFAGIRKTMPTQKIQNKGGNGEEKEEETEEPTAGPENLNYVGGKQRQPEESGENAKGTLR